MKKLDLLLSAPRSDRRKKTRKTIEAYKIIRNTFRTKKQIDTKTKVFVFFTLNLPKMKMTKNEDCQFGLKLKRNKFFTILGSVFDVELSK